MRAQQTHNLSFSVGDLSFHLLRTALLTPSFEPAISSNFPHSHPFLELHYTPSGNCSYTAGDTVYDLEPKQLLLIPPHLRHALSRRGQSACRASFSVFVQPFPSGAGQPSRSLYDALHPSRPILLDVPDASPLAEALEHICALIGQYPLTFSGQESLRAYSALLLAALSDHLPQPPAPARVPASHASAPQSFLIDQFFTVPSLMAGGSQALASQLNVSPRRLDRILQNTCGMNFRQMLNQAKLNCAINLLNKRECSIAQIAELLGYSTSTAFCAFIKKSTGQTPSQLRRNGLANTPR